MKKIFLFTVLINFSLSGICQDLQRKMKGLEPKAFNYEYLDRDSNDLYTAGWIEQMYPYPVFRKVQLEEKTHRITIEGITTVSGSISDTAEWGFCCFNVLVAQVTKKGTLYNVRRFGYTLLKNDSLNLSGRDGFFSISFRLMPNDMLIIGSPGRHGHGALVYHIGKLLKKVYDAHNTGLPKASPPLAAADK
jgi:hypothetical protein